MIQPTRLRVMLFLTAAAATALSFALNRFSPQEHASAFSVAPNSQRMIAPEGNRTIVAFYRVSNSGSRPLTFGRTSTTCGCSLASISPKCIKPGEEAVITIQGTPPPSGEKTVRAEVQTDDPNGKSVILDLTMVGNAAPPFVAKDSGPVHFGEVFERPARQTFWIVATENAKDAPWLSVPQSSQELSLDGGMVEEKIVGDLAFRKYEFSVDLEVPDSPGTYAGVVKFSPPGQPPHEVKVQAVFRSAVFAIPPVLYASSAPGEPSPEFVVRLKSLNEGFSLSVKPPKNSGDSLEVRPLAGEDDSAFRVLWRGSSSETTTRRLVFTTNHPKMPEVVVPLTIKGTGITASR
ncbi:hypothetical protein VT85_24500 [Planctomyces sp. SH-PL62]|nr:hypothetical protein VT85_24500 [Planctomyces sp. SH-PL62]